MTHSLDYSEFLIFKAIAKEFPILQQQVHDKPLVYLDNAATTQKPQCVIDAISAYYAQTNSNVHRGVHCLSQKATGEYETSREAVQKFINAKEAKEIIFTKGATEGINLVAAGLRNFKYDATNKFHAEFKNLELLEIKAGDQIVVSAMEHHANIVPWQMLCKQTGAILKVIPMNKNGELLLDDYKKVLLNKKVKIVALNYVSNSLGTINPVAEMIRLAHEKHILVLLDAAQAMQHLPVDVQNLDCDFLVFSGHKLYGPTGIGVLYGKEKYLNALPPYQGGGDMIKSVTFEETTYNELPLKFEAGTPNIAGAIGLKEAISFVTAIGMTKIADFEHSLLTYATDEIKKIEGVALIGTAQKKASVLSFVVEDVHPSDIGLLLDNMGIAVRTGRHCTQPVMDFYQIPGTVRASFAIYNTSKEIDNLIEGLSKAIRMCTKNKFVKA